MVLRVRYRSDESMGADSGGPWMVGVVDHRHRDVDDRVRDVCRDGETSVSEAARASEADLLVRTGVARTRLSDVHRLVGVIFYA